MIKSYTRGPSYTEQFLNPCRNYRTNRLLRQPTDEMTVAIEGADATNRRDDGCKITTAGHKLKHKATTDLFQEGSKSEGRKLSSRELYVATAAFSTFCLRDSDAC